MSVGSSLRSSLRNRRIVVTRAAHQATDLNELLRDRGAVPLAYPCIAIALPQDTGPLDAALQTAAAGAFDWLVLTSTNTILVLARRLHDLGMTRGSLASVAVAAVGPSTADAAQRLLGLKVSLVPPEYIAESLVASLEENLKAGQRVLLPQSDIARPVLAQGLVDAGAAVVAVTAYRTVLGHGGVDLPTLLARGQIDAITLTSSSIARNFRQRLAAEGGDLSDLRDVCLACIGPITAKTARRQGLPVNVVAEDHALQGLVVALETYFMR